MKTNKKHKKGYGWRCGFEKIYGSFHADNERCYARSRKSFNSPEDAARAGLSTHSCHSKNVYVFHHGRKGYIGNAVGINFHGTKS